MSQDDTEQGADERQEIRPVFYIGQHDSTRHETLDDMQYWQVLNAGFSYVTTPVTNAHFHERIRALVEQEIQALEKSAIPSCHPDPVVPPLTTEDTTLFPGVYTSGFVAYSSPWIDLSSPNPIIASISRQALNLEVSYANFCGVRTVIIPGPRQDSLKSGNGQGVAQYARAIQEAMLIAGRVSFIIHLPMYREPGLEEKVDLLGTTISAPVGLKSPEEIDLFSAWDSWHTIRSVCDYDTRLFVGLQIPHVLPEKELQTRWYSEPLQYLTFSPRSFQSNRTGHPSMSKHHQEMLLHYMKLKNAPYFLLCDLGPTPEEIGVTPPPESSSEEYPTLAEAAQHAPKTEHSYPKQNLFASYLRYIERQQEAISELEQNTLTAFQDLLQSPLQPLSDNLESITYEVFEGDPVKYDQYELAIAKALRDWSEGKKPPSSPSGAVIIAVAGSGRGPLVSRALKASQSTGVPVQVWAVEKNPNAYVYLLRQNQSVWDGKVTVVKTDMRAWKGPLIAFHASGEPIYGKVDILISELLGSFGDNELSPECLDGIQHVLAKPHGISIPKSYTAHMTPISTPRLYSEITQRFSQDPNSYETPWVVRLFQMDFVAQRVPDHARFQQAWEFVHPIPQVTMDMIEARRSGGVVGGGGGSMSGGVGANDHNSRHCHLTFVCRTRGVIHGLAGYFESVLYAPVDEQDELVELSTLPDMIDRKSKDMISWFPIFFPLKQPMYFPPDTEIEVSMWRQTDDTKVWYEWLVEAFTWTGPNQRVKVGYSEMCSSRKVACLM